MSPQPLMTLNRLRLQRSNTLMVINRGLKMNMTLGHRPTHTPLTRTRPITGTTPASAGNVTLSHSQGRHTTRTRNLTGFNSNRNTTTLTTLGPRERCSPAEYDPLNNSELGLTSTDGPLLGLTNTGNFYPLGSQNVLIRIKRTTRMKGKLLPRVFCIFNIPTEKEIGRHFGRPAAINRRLTSNDISNNGHKKDLTNWTFMSLINNNTASVGNNNRTTVTTVRNGKANHRDLNLRNFLKPANKRFNPRRTMRVNF